MGTLVNRWSTTWLASALAVGIVALNVLLIYESLYTMTNGALPGIPGLN